MTAMMPSLLATIADTPLWMQGLTLLLVGMGVVFGALLLLWLSLKIVGYVTRAKKQRAEVTPPATDTDEAVPHEHLVVISAAVAAICGSTARVRRVKFLRTGKLRAWADQGRVEIQASHHLRKQQHP